jgi:hypothetical protein
MPLKVIFKTVTKFETPLGVALPVLINVLIDMLRCMLPGGGIGVEVERERLVEAARAEEDKGVLGRGEGGTVLVGAMYSTSAIGDVSKFFLIIKFNRLNKAL